MADNQSLLLSDFSVVHFLGPVLKEMNDKYFVYNESATTLPSRLFKELKDRFPEAEVEILPTDVQPSRESLKADGMKRIVFSVSSITPHLPLTLEKSEPIKRRMTAKTAEAMMESMDRKFQRFSLSTFVQRRQRSLKHALFKVEFPFTDLEPKRIPIVKRWEQEMTALENASMLMTSYALELERNCASALEPLATEIERALFDEQGKESPRMLCAEFFSSSSNRTEMVVDEQGLDNLGLLFSQYLLFLKKALIYHERNLRSDKVDWQERAWKAFNALCVEISERIEGMADLNSLSFVSIRPKPLNGPLLKKGDKGFVKGWKRRYFVQHGKLLQYFKSENELGALQGSIDLSVVRQVEERNDPQLGPIIAVHIPGRVFLLAPAVATNESEINESGDLPIVSSASASSSSRAEQRLQQEALVAEKLKFWLAGLRAWRGYLQHLRYDEQEVAQAGLMSGNLWKKGVRGMRGKGLGWKQRYFTQIGDSLFYYEQSGLTALGRIDLTDVNWIYFPRPNRKRKFKLHTLRDDRIWTLRCDSETELEVWRAGILRYCQNGPPSESKLARESMNWPDRNSEQLEDSVDDMEPVSAPDLGQLFHSVITEDSTSVVMRTSGSLPSVVGASERYVSLTCVKCSSINCCSRRICSNCGQKLRIVVESDPGFRLNRRMTNLPPLPINMPPKSDKEAHRAWKDLSRRYKEAGLDPSTLPKKASTVMDESESGISLSSDDDDSISDKIEDDSVILFVDGSRRSTRTILEPLAKDGVDPRYAIKVAFV